MVIFGTEEELAEYLGRIQSNYRGYAAPLWASEERSENELANSSTEDLVAAGIASRLDASDIKANAGVHA
jgi:hypothetical protein